MYCDVWLPCMFSKLLVIWVEYHDDPVDEEESEDDDDAEHEVPDTLDTVVLTFHIVPVDSRPVMEENITKNWEVRFEQFRWGKD